MSGPSEERQRAGASYDGANKGREDRLKIILLGDSAVGKSKLVERFLMDQYQPQQLSTYALTLFSFETKVDDTPVKIDFWDTAGQERFDSMHPSYYYKADCCILVFDVSRKITYTNLLKWYKELQENRKGIPIIVVANKIDVDYRVTSKAFNFASKRDLPFYFCSAADGTNVVKVFDEAIRHAIQFRESPPSDFVQDVLDLLDELE